MADQKDTPTSSEVAFDMLMKQERKNNPDLHLKTGPLPLTESREELILGQLLDIVKQEDKETEKEGEKEKEEDKKKRKKSITEYLFGGGDEIHQNKKKDKELDKEKEEKKEEEEEKKEKEGENEEESGKRKRKKSVTQYFFGGKQEEEKSEKEEGENEEENKEEEKTKEERGKWKRKKSISQYFFGGDEIKKEEKEEDEPKKREKKEEMKEEDKKETKIENEDVLLYGADDYCRVERWAPDIESVSFPTAFVPLTQEEIIAILKHKEHQQQLRTCFRIQKKQAILDKQKGEKETKDTEFSESQKWKQIQEQYPLREEYVRILRELEKKLQNHLELFDYEQDGAFVKLSTRSPKDSALEGKKIRKLLFDLLKETKETKKEEKKEERKEEKKEEKKEKKEEKKEEKEEEKEEVTEYEKESSIDTTHNLSEVTEYGAFPGINEHSIVDGTEDREGETEEEWLQRTMTCFVRCCSLSLRVTSGKEALELLLNSNRIYEDLTRLQLFFNKQVLVFF